MKPLVWTFRLMLRIACGLPGWVLARLSRVTSSGRFIPEIDGLRFIAIAGVLLFHSQGHYFPTVPKGQTPLSDMPEAMSAIHASDWMSAPFLSGINELVSHSMHFVISNGWFGVQLFFIISGFILCTPFAEQHLLGRPKVSLKKYFIRRVTRLEPPYLISLTVMLVMILAMPQYSEFGNMPRSELFQHYLASAFYIHNIAYGDGSIINYVAWSLEVEIQFYILAPIFCLLFMIRWPIVRRGVIAAIILASILQDQYYANGVLNRCIIGQVRFFLLGFLLADIYLTEWRSAPSKVFKWDLIGLLAWAALPLMFLPVDWIGHYRNYFFPIILLVGYMAAFRGRIINKFFANPWIAAVGGMCYTIYLYHVGMVYWVRRLVEECAGVVYVGDFPLCFLRLLAGSLIIVGVCSVLFVLFEKPFMRKDWPARFARGVVALWQAILPARPQDQQQPAAVPVEAEQPADSRARKD